jgi:hypothetical protein
MGREAENVKVDFWVVVGQGGVVKVGGGESGQLA